MRMGSVCMPARDRDLTQRAAVGPARGLRVIDCRWAPVGAGRYDRHGFGGGLDLGYHDLLDRLATTGIVSFRFDRRGAGTTALGPEIRDFGFSDWLAYDQRLSSKHYPGYSNANVGYSGKYPVSDLKRELLAAAERQHQPADAPVNERRFREYARVLRLVPIGAPVAIAAAAALFITTPWSNSPRFLARAI